MWVRSTSRIVIGILSQPPCDVPRDAVEHAGNKMVEAAVFVGFLCGLWDGPAVGTWAYGRLRLRATSKDPSMLKNITGKTATAFSMRRYRSG